MSKQRRSKPPSPSVNAKTVSSEIPSQTSLFHGFFLLFLGFCPFYRLFNTRARASCFPDCIWTWNAAICSARRRARGGLGSDLLGAWVYLHDVAVAFASRESSRPAVELGNNEVGTPMRRPFVGDGEYAG